jgi:outer membrane protein OmpA-like peptidoglycan-associated protein
VVDFRVLQKLDGEEKYKAQVDEYSVRFAPASASTIQAESEEILTKTIVIHFFPNSWEIDKMVTKDVDGKQIEEKYDPNAQFVIEEVGQLAGQYGAARIVIEGHTDASMKGQVPPALVKDLAQNRANAVKESLVKKFPTLEPNQFAANGIGWDRPSDPADPANHAKNRRVEIKVYPAEKPQ